MATLVLGIAGGAIGAYLGGPGGAVAGWQIGAAIGGFGGALIDTFVLQPAIFGRNNSIAGPRLDDLSVQSASEGSPMRWVMSAQNRTAGTVFWFDELVPHTSTQEPGKGGGGPSVTTTTYTRTVAIHLADCWDGPIHRVVKLFADGKLLWDLKAEDTTVLYEDDHVMEVSGNSKFSELTIYKGTPDQPVDPYIESIKGEGKTPNRKKTAWVLIKDLQWADYGNRLPNITAEVQESLGKSVGETIVDILTRAEFEDTEYDVTRVPGCLRGYTITGVQEAGQCLDVITSAYFLSYQQSNSKLVFFARGKETVIDIEERHLAAYVEGNQPNRLVKITDCDTSKLPQQVYVNGWYDPDTDLQVGSQPSRRINIDSKVVLTANFPISLKREEAKQIAYRLAWLAEAECSAVEFTLPPSYIHLEEGDVARFSIGDRVVSIRMDEITRGHNYMLEVKGVKTQSHLYGDIVMGVSNTPGSQGPYVPPVTVLEMMDLPALQESQLTKPGVYYAVCAEDRDATWRGAKLFRSNDDLSYTEVASASSECSMGYCATILPDGPTLVWDEHPSMEVELFHGSLENATEDAVLEGANWALVGEEIIGFREAEQLSATRWRISKFLRGLRNTERYTASHSPEERFVRLSTSGVRFHDMTTPAIGTTKYFRAPALGSNLSDAETESLTISGNTLRSFSPADFLGVVDSGDIVFTWARRSRAFAPPFAPSTGILLDNEVPETYEIDIIRGSFTGGEIVRTFTVVEGVTQTYLAADIASDGFSGSGAVIRARIYQVNQSVGRGNPAETEVIL